MTEAAGAPVVETSDQLHETALVDVHRGLGARLIEFGGWLMPVQYAGILEEHKPFASAPRSSTSRTWASCSSRATMPAMPSRPR